MKITADDITNGIELARTANSALKTIGINISGSAPKYINALVLLIKNLSA